MFQFFSPFFASCHQTMGCCWLLDLKVVLWSHTCDGSLRSRLFFPPQRNEDGDVTNPSVPKPVHSQLDPPAGKHLLIPVAVEHREPNR